MTIVFTAIRPFCIVAACDSAVKEEMDDGDPTYTTGRKSFTLPGVGVVSTWGVRDGNAVGQVVHQLRETGEVATVEGLAERVMRYLEEEFDPGAAGLGDVGYHICGFQEGRPRLFHAYYNTPDPDRNKAGGYMLESYPDHVLFEQTGRFAMLYNGRSDLAQAVISSLSREINRGQDPPTRLSDAYGVVAFAHLIMRFAAELTHDVGPPFVAHVIAPNNDIESAELPDWQPLGDRRFLQLREFANAIEPLRLEGS